MVQLIVAVTLVLCATAWALPSPLSPDSEVKNGDGHVLEKSVPCNPEVCKLPSCRCSSIELDASIPAKDTPQVSGFNENKTRQKKKTQRLKSRMASRNAFFT